MITEKGITLIPLVITIIVIFILSGISILFIVGDNGILVQARNGVVTNREAKAREEVTIAWASADTEYWKEWTKDSTKNKEYYFTKENLSKYTEGTGKVIESKENTDGSYTVRYQANDQGIIYIFTIDTNGNVSSSLSGESLQEKAKISFKVNYHWWDDEKQEEVWSTKKYEAEEDMSWYEFLSSNDNGAGDFYMNRIWRNPEIRKFFSVVLLWDYIKK